MAAADALGAKAPGRTPTGGTAPVGERAGDAPVVEDTALIAPDALALGPAIVLRLETEATQASQDAWEREAGLPPLSENRSAEGNALETGSGALVTTPRRMVISLTVTESDGPRLRDMVAALERPGLTVYFQLGARALPMTPLPESHHGPVRTGITRFYAVDIGEAERAALLSLSISLGFMIALPMYRAEIDVPTLWRDALLIAMGAQPLGARIAQARARRHETGRTDASADRTAQSKLSSS